MVRNSNKKGKTGLADAGGRVYLVWGQAQGPQCSIMGIHCFQKASGGQLKDLQLPALKKQHRIILLTGLWP